MKSNDILILGVVGVVGYGLYKSDFFKGLGGVGSGVGAAVGGFGAGVGAAGQAAGYNLAEVFSAVGELGKQSTMIIKEGGQLVSETTHELREDVVKTADYLGDIPVDVAKTAGGWSSVFEQTWNPEKEQSIIQASGRGGRNVYQWLKKGSGSVFSWIKEQVSPEKTLKAPMTAAVIQAPAPTPAPAPTQTIRGGGGSGYSGVYYRNGQGYSSAFPPKPTTIRDIIPLPTNPLIDLLG